MTDRTGGRHLRLVADTDNDLVAKGKAIVESGKYTPPAANTSAASSPGASTSTKAHPRNG
jgi:hypothetical protein